MTVNRMRIRCHELTGLFSIVFITLHLLCPDSPTQRWHFDATVLPSQLNLMAS